MSNYNRNHNSFKHFNIENMKKFKIIIITFFITMVEVFSQESAYKKPLNVKSSSDNYLTILLIIAILINICIGVYVIITLKNLKEGVRKYFPELTNKKSPLS